MVGKILYFAGSLCFLLHGMHLMSEGIQKSAGKSLKAALRFMTGNRFIGMVTGCLLTMIIQSSGATTVMVVTFVNAGLISLEQSVGVIFGANIGTTVTAWIVAFFGFGFEMKTFAVPLFGIGFLLTVFKRFRKENVGQAVMGFGMLFIGLGWLSKAFEFGPEEIKFLINLQNFGSVSLIFAVLVGIVFAALMHSSSAMSAIVITLAHNGAMTWEFASAAIIGSGIGSTIDSVMAAFGGKANAKRCALINVLFNCLNVLLCIIFLRPLLNLVDFIVPGTPQENITYHIAMLNTMFKTIGTIIFIPWTKQFALLTEKIIKQKKEEQSYDHYEFPFSERIGREMPESCVFAVQKEISRFADVVVEIFDDLQLGFMKREKSFIDENLPKIKLLEDYTDLMHEELTNYLVRCNRLDISDRSAKNVNVMIQVCEDLESLADHCVTVGMLLKKAIEQDLPFNQDDMDLLIPYVELARQLLYFIYKNIGRHLNNDQFVFAGELEHQIDEERWKLKKVARTRLESGANVKSELLYLDIVRQIEKMGDNCFSIAENLAA